MTWVAVLVIAFLLGACSTGSVEDPRPAGYAGMAAALCDAASSAETDVGAARDTFLDDAHELLHELASELAETDRAASAAVLEAKQVAEADFENEANGSTIETDLLTLHSTVSDGLEQLGTSVPGCS